MNSVKRLTRWLVATTIFSAILLLGGNTRDPWLWAYAAAFSAIGAYALYSMTDELASERFNPPSAGADRLSLRTVRLVALAHLIAGIADSRYGWTHVPDPLRAIGLAGFSLSYILMARAMLQNPFFSAVVRIQHERGHRVVQTGAYAVVRHPGYAGMILLAPLSGLALGSWIAVGLALAYSALILRRVLFEDHFLQENLEGYRSYTTRVRYRLVPGLW